MWGSKCKWAYLWEDISLHFDPPYNSSSLETRRSVTWWGVLLVGLITIFFQQLQLTRVDDMRIIIYADSISIVEYNYDNYRSTLDVHDVVESFSTSLKMVRGKCTRLY